MYDSLYLSPCLCVRSSLSLKSIEQFQPILAQARLNSLGKNTVAFKTPLALLGEG